MQHPQWQVKSDVYIDAPMPGEMDERIVHVKMTATARTTNAPLLTDISQLTLAAEASVVNGVLAEELVHVNRMHEEKEIVDGKAGASGKSHLGLAVFRCFSCLRAC